MLPVKVRKCSKKGHFLLNLIFLSRYKFIYSINLKIMGFRDDEFTEDIFI